MDKRIPKVYQHLWKPYQTNKTLFHLTTLANWEAITRLGYLEPRDPSPRNWAGMKAIFMADPDDPLYPSSLPHVLAHVKKKEEELVRLHIQTSNQLYRSIDPERTFQVASLDPIPIDQVIDVEPID